MICCILEIEDEVQKDKLTVDEIISNLTTNREVNIDNLEEVHAVTINSTTAAKSSTTKVSGLSNNTTGNFTISQTKGKELNKHNRSHISNDIDNTREIIDNDSENGDKPMTDGTTLSSTSITISSNKRENISLTTEKTIVDTNTVTETYNDSQSEDSGKN